MEKKSRRLYIGGSALFAAVALLVAVVFTLLCRTDKTDTYLADTRAQRFGWRYTLLSDAGAQDWEPVFESDYAVQLPPDTRAVRLTRAMTESIPRAELEWNLYCTGVEVTLDGAVLYTDFAGAGHDADGFARPAAADWARINARAEGMWRRVRMTLPADYVGQTLCVTTYFSPGEPVGAPEYPTLGSEDSLMALMLTEQTLPTVSAVFYALLALVLAGMFALDVSIGGTGAGTLLMCLFYALLFLDTAYNSETGYYSLLQAYPALGFLSGLELVPLFLFMTMRRKARLKYPLCAGIVLWAVCVGALQFRNLHDGLALDAGRSGLAALGIFAALLLVFLVDMVRHRDGAASRKTGCSCSLRCWPPSRCCACSAAAAAGAVYTPTWGRACSAPWRPGSLARSWACWRRSPRWWRRCSSRWISSCAPSRPGARWTSCASAAA